MPHDPRSVTGQGVARRWRQPEARWREFVLQLVVAIGTLLISVDQLGPKLFLIYLYGWTRVSHEQLRILAMPKGGSWPLSNGGMINHGYFICYLISLACWLALFFVAYLLLRRLFPMSKKP